MDSPTKYSTQNSYNKGISSHACNKCGLTKTDKDKFLSCDFCNRTYHLDCQKVSVQTYEYLHSKDNTDLLWMCSMCKSNTDNDMSHRNLNGDELITSIQRVIMEQTAKIDSKLTEHNQRVEQKIGTELIKIKSDLRSKCDKTAVDTLIKELEMKQNCELKRLESAVTNRFQRMTSCIEKITKRLESVDQAIAYYGNTHMEDKQYIVSRTQDQMKEGKADNRTTSRTFSEVAERRKKRKNLILFGVPESTKKFSWEKESDDMNKVQSIIKEELNLSVNIQTASRVGEKSPRPLILCIPDDRIRSQILLKAKFLCHGVDPMRKKIFIRPDMTKLQRIENNNLVSSMMTLNKREAKKGTDVQWMIKRGLVKQPRMSVQANKTYSD